MYDKSVDPEAGIIYSPRGHSSPCIQIWVQQAVLLHVLIYTSYLEYNLLWSGLVVEKILTLGGWNHFVLKNDTNLKRVVSFLLIIQFDKTIMCTCTCKKLLSRLIFCKVPSFYSSYCILSDNVQPSDTCSGELSTIIPSELQWITKRHMKNTG